MILRLGFSYLPLDLCKMCHRQTLLVALDDVIVEDVAVRSYCMNGLIPGACQNNNVWLIPETAEKPKRKAREETEAVRPAFARKLGNQQKKRNYHGMYDYTILNLTYSSCRMASCRLTRRQIESIIKNGKAQPSFEPMKISDLIEARNHVVCVDFILKAPMEPLSTKYIKDLHRKLFSGTVDEQLERVVSGVYRRPSIKRKNRELPLAMEIPDMMKQLIKVYEKKENVHSIFYSIHMKYRPT